MFFKIFKTRKELQSLVNASRKSLAEAEERVFERNKLIGYQADEIKELKSKIKDLENNVEFLVNNLTKLKKELVRPGNQN